jgi:hypothetical protein
MVRFCSFNPLLHSRACCSWYTRAFRIRLDGHINIDNIAQALQLSKKSTTRSITKDGPRRGPAPRLPEAHDCTRVHEAASAKNTRSMPACSATDLHQCMLGTCKHVRKPGTVNTFVSFLLTLRTPANDCFLMCLLYDSCCLSLERSSFHSP